jgi:hypothetical protein
MEIEIIKFDDQLVNGQHEPRQTSFDAFCGAIKQNLTRYHDFVSTCDTRKIYRQKDYDLIRRSFNLLYSFRVLQGFAGLSTHGGLYFTEIWEHTGRHYVLKQFRCIPPDEFLEFVDVKNNLDDRKKVDKVEQYFCSIE